MEPFFVDYELISNKTSQEGSFASVYKVRHNTLGYVTAIKVLNNPISDEKDVKYQKFLKECKILLRLGNGSNPYIVRIGQPKLRDHHALVEMEYLEGEDLNDYLHRCEGFIPISEVFTFLQNICCALAYCHFDIYKFCINRNVDDIQVDKDGKPDIPADSEKEKELVKKYQVLHNDIHSKNVIRKNDGRYILLDFGLAIIDDSLVQSSSRLGGCTQYMPPEKFEGKTLTEQSDIYSLGILMYEMLAGSVPFRLKDNSMEAIHELFIDHRDSVPVSIEAQREIAYEKKYNQKWEKDYPDWLEEMILKCLEKDPAKRFPNAKKLNDFLLEKLKNENPLNGRILLLEQEIQDLEKGKTSSEELISKMLVSNDEKEVKHNEEITNLLNKAKEQPAINTTKRTGKGNSIFLKLTFAACLLLIALAGYKVIKKAFTNETKEVTAMKININNSEFTYTGQLFDDLPNGFGTAEYKDGKIYKGEFKNGLQDGSGKLTSGNGSYYGEFNQDDLQGCSMFISNRGGYHIGEYDHGKANGMHTYFDRHSEFVEVREYKNDKVINTWGTILKVNNSEGFLSRMFN